VRLDWVVQASSRPQGEEEEEEEEEEEAVYHVLPVSIAHNLFSRTIFFRSYACLKASIYFGLFWAILGDAGLQNCVSHRFSENGL